jgi:hypothetical protein
MYDACMEPSSSVRVRHAAVEMRAQRMLLARPITALRLPSGLQEAEDEAAARARGSAAQHA